MHGIDRRRSRRSVRVGFSGVGDLSPTGGESIGSRMQEGFLPTATAGLEGERTAVVVPWKS
jgi:hypothetical protein